MSIKTIFDSMIKPIILNIPTTIGIAKLFRYAHYIKHKRGSGSVFYVWNQIPSIKFTKDTFAQHILLKITCNPKIGIGWKCMSCYVV
jgi:hypothetical protein